MWVLGGKIFSWGNGQWFMILMVFLSVFLVVCYHVVIAAFFSFGLPWYIMIC
jgi:hypothetical protein